ncbi:glutathione S-transferase [Pigmentiphaga soli]|uniref:Glutathione S-transferase n=1 Tax=Pigmentiphaga soli TaxID=1007095 RepID=A0ABP8GHE2_9BURK
MKFIYTPASPFARKVLVAAHEAGIAGRLQLVEQAVSPVARNPEVAARNPLAKVPVLELDDGTPLYDSRVIVAYLAELPGAASIMPPGAQRWPALRLHALADGLLDAAVLLRYETALRPVALRWPEWIDGQMGKVRAALDSIEADAAALQGPATVERIAVACALGYLDFRFAGEDWRCGRPGAAAFYEAFSQRPSMKATAPA